MKGVVKKITLISRTGLYFKVDGLDEELALV